jgi:hypothetical protein
VVGVGLGIGLGRVTTDERPRRVAMNAAPEKALPFEEPASHYAPPTEIEAAQPVQPIHPSKSKTTAPQPAAKVVAPKPKSAADEKPAWLKYASLTPPTEGRPMIAIVIDDVGHDSGAQARRLDALPAPVTLALLPYVRHLPDMAAMFRRSGHELMVHMPMEPTDHNFNPGPNALLTELSDKDLIARLNWNLSRFTGYVGVNNHMGSRFTRDNDAMALVLSQLQKRGLLFVDSRTIGGSVGDSLARWMGVPWARRDVFLDNDLTPGKILNQLHLTERIAAKRGFAVAIGHPHAATLDTLEQWLPQVRKKGFALVPITAIVRAHLTG